MTIRPDLVSCKAYAAKEDESQCNAGQHHVQLVHGPRTSHKQGGAVTGGREGGVGDVSLATSHHTWH